MPFHLLIFIEDSGDLLFERVEFCFDSGLDLPADVLQSRLTPNKDLPDLARLVFGKIQTSAKNGHDSCRGLFGMMESVKDLVARKKNGRTCSGNDP